MTNNPLDVNTREMIGKILFLLSVTTDPSQTIMLTSSAITWVKAGLHKIGVHDCDDDLKRCRKNWKGAKGYYLTGQAGWSTCEDILSDLRDFLFDVAVEHDIIIIRKEWYNMSADGAGGIQMQVNPMGILDEIGKA